MHHCSERLVQCPHASCQMAFVASQAKHHAKTDCAMIKRRQALIHEKMNLSNVSCPQCSASVNPRKLEHHQQFNVWNGWFSVL